MKIEPRYRRATLALLIASALTACNKDDSSSSAAQPSTPAKAEQDTQISIVAHGVKHWLPYSLNEHFKKELSKVSVTQEELTLEANDDTIMTAQGKLVLSNGQLSYVSLSGVSEIFTVTNQAGEISEEVEVSINNVIGDPLANEQWHLHNTGQMGYARPEGLSEIWHERLMNLLGDDRRTREEADAEIAKLESLVGSVAGEDMNVLQAYAQGVTGKDTIVVVVDSGLELNHEDLADNVLPNRSLNFRELNNDPTNNRATTGDHGTSVAGLIASKGWNGIGGRGVAPDASLIGMNYLAVQNPSFNMITYGMAGSGISTSEPIVAFNRSYGRDNIHFSLFDEMDYEMTLYSATELRNGKGALNVKSSGNSFESSFSTGNFCKHTGAHEYGLTCTNAAMESDLSYHHFVTVGAVNADGTKSSYSTSGPNLFVSAPAGERGVWEPAMVTPDQSTCLRGYASLSSLAFLDSSVYNYPIADIAHKFESGKVEGNLSCNYTNTFAGTSSAAPNTSGVVALIASANPELHWRDIKHILALSSDKNNPEDAPVELPVGNGSFTAHLGWVTNDAGFNFNNHYGFGRVNAGKAVELAKNYQDALPEQLDTRWFPLVNTPSPAEGLEIPDNSPNGAEAIVTVEDSVTIESTLFLLDIFNEELIAPTFNRNTSQSTAGIDLAIEVTSPAGTKSVLLSSRQAILNPVQTTHSPRAMYAEGYIMKDSVINSNAFYGENSRGKWKIRFLDTNANDIKQASYDHAEFLNNVANTFVENAHIKFIGH